MTGPIDIVEETVVCVCLRYSTNNEVDDSLRQGTGVSQQKRLSFGDWFRFECLEYLQCCMNILRANHAVSPFLKRTPRQLRHFCPNSFYEEC